MQQYIPDELGQQITDLAEGLNLDVDVVVRQALESWVARVQRTNMRRLPDSPLLDEGMTAPYDLPHSPAHRVEVKMRRRHLPDEITLH